MVPTVRPSLYTSIFAPTRCGVEPVVDTIVTSAAGSPFSRASETAAKTSWFTDSDYSEALPSCRAGRSRPCGPGGPVDLARVRRLGARDERFVDDLRARRRREFAALRADRDEADAVGHVERHAALAGGGGLHELRP